MNINPSNLAAGPNPSADVNQILRMNQRFSGEILQVAGDRVTLSVQGVQIVARMVSTEQSAELIDRKFAHFVVKEASPNNILLQLLPSPKFTAAQGSQASSTNIASQILKQMGIDISQENIKIVNALVQRGINVDKNLIQDIRQALDSLGAWGETEANLAAALKESGLPLSSGTVALAMRTLSFKLNESIQGLQAQLIALSQSHLKLAEEIKQALQFLSSLPVDIAVPSEKLPQQIQQSLQNLLGSVESKLAEFIRADSTFSLPQDGIFSLLKLRQSLQAQGMNDLCRQIDNLMDGLRMMQLINIPEVSQKNFDTRLILNIPLQAEPSSLEKLPDPAPETELAQMRISFRQQTGDQPNKSQYNHLTIQIDVEDGKPIEVDLSIVGKQLISAVTSPDAELDAIAQSEFSSLNEQLSSLGFTILSSKFAIEHPGDLSWAASCQESKIPIRSVNMKA